jgi:RNA polymerase sigma factor (sigma-70 family)
LSLDRTGALGNAAPGFAASPTGTTAVCYNRVMEEAAGRTDEQISNVGLDTNELALRALISGIVGHDEGAMAALYDATVSRVFALALRITGDHQAAEEVVADVYLQIWRQSHLYDQRRGTVSAWIYTICRSRALDYLRRRDVAETTSEPEALRPEFSDSAADPLDALLGMERTSEMYAALQILDPTERQLLTMAFFRDLTHQEIARHTGMPLGSVKTVLRKAMHTLKRKLELQAPRAE